jgi:hypothetical protein
MRLVCPSVSCGGAIRDGEITPSGAISGDPAKSGPQASAAHAATGLSQKNGLFLNTTLRPHQPRACLKVKARVNLLEVNS